MIEIDGIYIDPKHIESIECFDQPEPLVKISMVSGKVFYLCRDLVKAKDIMERILERKEFNESKEF
jgi:uncharacterized protein YlzI (FlbEa/FlbD family)